MDTPFANLLNTNHVPSDAQLAQLRTFLDDEPRTTMTAFDTQEQNLLNALESLRKKKGDCQSFIDKHKAIMSPFRRLPFDVLQTIFLFCIPVEHNAVMSTSQAPMLLTHVCHRWREATLSMPSLWATLHIPIPAQPAGPYRSSLHEYDSFSVAFAAQAVGANPPPPAPLREEEHQVLAYWKAVYDTSLAHWKRKMEVRMAFVEEWLRRAGGLKLSINIIEWAPPPDRRTITHSWKNKLPGQKIKLLDILKSHAARWERLELSVTWRFLSEILSTEAPNMKYFKVCYAPMSPPNFFESNSRFVMSQVTSDEEEDQSAEEAAASAAQAAAQTMYTESKLLKSSKLSTLYLKTLTTDIFLLPTRWENITELFFEGYSSRFPTWTPLPGMGTLTKFGKTEAKDLLTRCPCLRKCHLLVGRGDRRNRNPLSLLIPNQAKEVITLQHLEHLSVHETNPREEEALASLFESFQFPALRSIVFTTSALPRLSRRSSLITLLTQCTNDIQKLAIDYRSFTKTDLSEVLGMVSETVEDLWLTVDYWETREGHWYYEDEAAAGMGATAVGPGAQNLNRPAPSFLMNDFLEELTPDIPPPPRSADAMDESGDAEPFRGVEPAVTVTKRVLCPNLRLFSCRLRSAEFDEPTLLKFIRARRSNRVLESGAIKQMIRRIKVLFAVKSREEIPAAEGDNQYNIGGMLVVEASQKFSTNQEKKKPAHNIHSYVFDSLKDDDDVYFGIPGVGAQKDTERDVLEQSQEARQELHTKGRLQVKLGWPPEPRIAFFPKGYPDLPTVSAATIASRVWSPHCGAFGTMSLPGGGSAENRGLTDSGVRIF
ncbi:hypothetical protein FA15DRAFT_663535 [Coprinopsis marcescibilis]|uniref:Uncharacterized protein n=1 Tax=Coprinopsis marcescibilis TaxID=230819 RepID=A0A5C3LC30_COPMA|nr:hypothetical protein FA15DRAFT_663535 [Coprinopsis marcescibilis]